MSKPCHDLGDVEGVVDDKFEYSGVVLKEFSNNLRLKADAVVPVFPAWVVGGGVGQFWRDGHKIAGDRLEYGTGGFDGDAFAKLLTVSGEVGEFWHEKGFATGKYDVWSIRLGHTVEQFIGGPRGPLRFPGGVGSVTEPASQIASGGTNEQGASAGPWSFALDGFKDFCDLHGPGPY